MRNTPCPSLALVVVAAVMLAPAAARAQMMCMSAADFNAFTMRTGSAASAGTLMMRFESRDMNRVPGEKSVLADMNDTRRTNALGRACQGISVKTWNDCRLADGSRCLCSGSPCSGKIKVELFDQCLSPPQESAADPLHSAPVFVSDVGMCDARIWFDADAIGYSIRCDNAPAPVEGRGVNTWRAQVNNLTLLSFSTGGYPFDTRLESAQFCFTPAATVSDGGAAVSDAGTTPTLVTIDVPVLEDVTVDSLNPSVVYSPVEDLAVAAGESEVYLKFQVGALPGRVTGAQLILHTAASGSAEGSGTSVFRAAGAAWSERTLTWSARPGRIGTRLARVGPVASDRLYTLDLEGADIAAGALAFALVPEPGDTNGVHYDSREVAGMRGAVLHLTVDTTPMMVADAGAPVMDAGTPVVDAGTVTAEAGTQGDARPGRDAGFVTMDRGCACRTTTPRRGAEGPYVALLALSAALAIHGRRRHRLRQLRSALARSTCLGDRMSAGTRTRVGLW